MTEKEMINNKLIISQLQLNSNALKEKAEISLLKADGFALAIYSIDNYKEEDFEQFFEILKLNFEFYRVYCTACNGYEYKCINPNLHLKPDKTGLCSRCMDMLSMLTVLNIDNIEIGKWMTSKGNVNPLYLIKNNRK